MDKHMAGGFCSDLRIDCRREPPSQARSVNPVSSENVDNQSMPIAVKRERSLSESEATGTKERHTGKRPRLASDLDLEDGEIDEQGEGQQDVVSAPTQVAIATIGSIIPAHYDFPLAYPVACSIPRSPYGLAGCVTSTDFGAPTEFSFPQLLRLVQQRDALTAQIRRQILSAARAREAADLQQEIARLEAELARLKQYPAN